MKNMLISKRDYRLDICRAIAIVAVVLNHALITNYDYTNWHTFANGGLADKFCLIVGFFISRFGVPFFLFLTGALILAKDINSKQDVINFYKKKLLPLVLITMIWNLIYYIFSVVVSNKQFRLDELFQILVFAKPSTLGNMWYMPMIIGMYVFLPFVSVTVKKFSFSSLLPVMIMTIVVYFIFPNLRALLGFFGADNPFLTTILDLSFSGARYGVYIILGYYVYRKNLLRRLNVRILWLIIIVGAGICCAMQLLSYTHYSNYIIYYDNIGLLLSSLGCFELLMRRKTLRESSIMRRWIEIISVISFGIFFVHRPLLVLLGKYLNPIVQTRRVGLVLIDMFVSMFLSVLVILILRKIKFVKKLFRI